ncbi:MAG TPA: LysM peptidoglycan-binding domain-containing protein [Candidatus Competibacteraceae bacterium]|nr:LysM peptidoglycan-binding domain-containing protein [Candidatus Competibacteraceae bacterium]
MRSITLIIGQHRSGLVFQFGHDPVHRNPGRYSPARLHAEPATQSIYLSLQCGFSISSDSAYRYRLTVSPYKNGINPGKKIVFYFKNHVFFRLFNSSTPETVSLNYICISTINNILSHKGTRMFKTSGNLILSCLFATLLLSMSGCATPPPQEKPAPPPTDTLYTAKKGDTLGRIAQETTGSKNNAQAIAEYNGLRNKNRIEIGQQFKIPAHLSLANAQSAAPASADTDNDHATDENSSADSEQNAAVIGAVLGGIVSAVLANQDDHKDSKDHGKQGRHQDGQIGQQQTQSPQHQAGQQNDSKPRKQKKQRPAKD